MTALRILALCVGHLWALPVSLAGLVVALGGGARFGFVWRGCLVWDVPERGLINAFLRRYRVDAFTWGACIIRDQFVESERLLRHERIHALQAFVLGPLMPVAYGLCSLWALLRGGEAYRDNYLEVLARRAERQTPQ